jgi:hypothetical protein
MKCTNRFVTIVLGYGLAGLGLLAGAVACVPTDEEEDPSNPEQQTEEVLTGGQERTWRIVRLEIDGETLSVDDTTCLGDNRHTFRIDQRNYRLQNGELKCDPDDPNDAMGTWDLRGNGDRIFIDADSVSQFYNIEDMSQDSLRVSYTASQGTPEETWVPLN